MFPRINDAGMSAGHVRFHTGLRCLHVIGCCLALVLLAAGAHAASCTGLGITCTHGSAGTCTSGTCPVTATCTNGYCDASGDPIVATCSCSGGSTGDPHLVSFDGLLYDLQAVGEFALTTDNAFELQVRQQSYAAACVSVNVAAAVKVGANRITFYASETPPLRIEGSPTDIACVPQSSSSSVGRSSIYPSASRCSGTLILADGTRVVLATSGDVPSYSIRGPNQDHATKITVRQKTYLDLTVAPGSGATIGLLGTHDGNAANDLQTRDGRILPQPISFQQLYQDFAEGWRVTQSESLFDYGAGQDTNTFTDRSFPVAPCPVASTQDEKRLAAENACQAAGITDNHLLEACVFDVMVTGDARFTDSYVDTASESNGVTASTMNAYGGGCDFSGRAPRGFPSMLLLVPALLLHRRRTIGSVPSRPL